MDDLGQVLRAERKRRDMTQADVARALNKSMSAIQQKETGVIPITDEEAREWAKVLGLEPNAVMLQTGRTMRRRIPVLDIVKAGRLVFESDTQEAWEPRYAQDFVAGTDVASDQSFALKVDGDSMAPMIPNGAIVICDPLFEGDEARLRDGDVVVAWVAPRKKGKGGSWEAGGVMGQWFYIRDTNTAEIRKVNPNYPKVTIDLGYEATPRIAVVIEWRIRPRR
jgi:phage repressor protein C with HTH and peptisase S24 domain